MPERTRWGLASAGNLSRSFVGRLPSVRKQLGPVYSTSFRLASRLSNSLRAGSPVRTAAELQHANPLLLCVPGLPMEQLANAQFFDALEWPDKIVLICDGWRDAATAQELRRRGASTAIVAAIPGFSDLFVSSGDRAAVHVAKTALRAMRAGSLEVPPEHLVLFETAVTLTSSLFTPLVETTVECLRQSGLEQQVAVKTADALFQHSLRGFKRAGRKSWSGPVAMADRDSVAIQAGTLAKIKPAMADYYRDAARFSFELYQTFPELTRYDKRRWQQFRKTYPPPS